MVIHPQTKFSFSAQSVASPLLVQLLINYTGDLDTCHNLAHELPDRLRYRLAFGRNCSSISGCGHDTMGFERFTAN